MSSASRTTDVQSNSGPTRRRGAASTRTSGQTTTTTTTTIRTTTTRSREWESFRSGPVVVISSDEESGNEIESDSVPSSPAGSNNLDLLSDVGSLSISGRPSSTTETISNLTTAAAGPLVTAENVPVAQPNPTAPTTGYQNNISAKAGPPGTPERASPPPPPYRPQIPHPDTYVDLPRTGKYWVVTCGTEVGIFTTW
ncbi:hypothetical protein V5O48_013645 [Marasmius crinis-equi]|uniref:Uncharacterized protein n=1 Tax=Marasmius crinis-equi TaxID=585013 RepID=A0ABR3EZL8_9AGAR